MSQEMITMLVGLISAAIVAVVLAGALIIAILNGELHNFIREKMIAAEETTMTGEQKLQYVIDAVKDKYKILSLIVNVKKVVEILIAFSKKVN